MTTTTTFHVDRAVQRCDAIYVLFELTRSRMGEKMCLSAHVRTRGGGRETDGETAADHYVRVRCKSGRTGERMGMHAVAYVAA